MPVAAPATAGGTDVDAEAVVAVVWVVAVEAVVWVVATVETTEDEPVAGIELLGTVLDAGGGTPVAGTLLDTGGGTPGGTLLVATEAVESVLTVGGTLPDSVTAVVSVEVKVVLMVEIPLVGGTSEVEPGGGGD